MKKIFLLFFVLILSLNSAFAEVEDTSIIDELNKDEVKELNVDFNLKSFESCDALENVMWDYIKDYWENNKSRYNYPVMYKSLGEPMVDSVSINSVMETSVSSDVSEGIWGGINDDFSETNTQVLGVDEADIIKTDWDYIYYYNDSGDYRENKYIYVIDAKNHDNLKIVKKIKVPSFFNNTQLFISENRLTILASWYSNTKYENYWINRSEKTYTIIYDTTDKTSPILKKLYITDWRLSKSRKIWKYLYVVSNTYFNIPYHNFKSVDDIKVEVNKIIPKKIDISKTSNSDNQNLKLKGKTYPFNVKTWNVAKCNEIEYVLPDSETLKKYDFNPSYNIISIIDIENTEAEVKTKVIAWNSAEIYMSLDNLYLTDRMYSSYNYSCPAWARCIMPFYYGWTTNTLVHKLNINGDSLKYQTSNIVPWSPLNQYSMDESEWKFRIITSTNNWGQNREEFTGLYILDENLEKYSSLEWLWEGENFQSSRFMWDKLFLVTFKQIDPLFVIELKDQKNPKVIGELKMPGYSTYLHPYDENHLIGLGYDTYENQWGGTRNWGLKIDLYEINYDKKVTAVSQECSTFSYNQCPNSCVKNSCASACEPDAEVCIDLCVEKCENPKDYSWDKDYIEVKQLYSHVLWDSWSYSEALRNPRMFMWNTNKNLLLLPTTIYLNESEDSYKHIDFFNGLVALEIDKDSWIKEEYKISHINTDWIEEKRDEECKKYLDKRVEDTECKKLIDGSTYCPPVRDYYIPEYCYADSPLWAYVASRSWNFKDSFIKRALWIWNSSFAISNDKITSQNLLDWKLIWEVEMK